MNRREHYAAQPDEMVAHPGVISTLFPHLGRDRANEFRWAFLIGIFVLLLLYAVGLITAAIIVGAILVPLLYVMYLYEVRAYRDAPIPVLGVTMGGGFVLGVVVTLVFRAVSSPTALIEVTPLGTTIDIAALLLAGVLIPVVQEVIKPIPALLLRRRPDFPETIDGLVFGIAAGLGFAAAVTVIQFSEVITQLPVQADPANWIYPLITLAVLMPLLQGSTTGVITAVLWRRGGLNGTSATSSFGPMAIAVAVVGHIAFVVGTILLATAQVDRFLSIAWQVLVVGGLLIVVRRFLHESLLMEDADLGLAQTACSNCGSRVTAAGFCPVCGMALSASPRDPAATHADLTAGPRVEGA